MVKHTQTIHIDNSLRIVWACLTIFGGSGLKG